MKEFLTCASCETFFSGGSILKKSKTIHKKQ